MNPSADEAKVNINYIRKQESSWYGCSTRAESYSGLCETILRVLCWAVTGSLVTCAWPTGVQSEELQCEFFFPPG